MARPSLLRRLTADAHVLDADELQADCAALAARPITGLVRGDHVTVAGRLRHVVYTPREHVATVSAELYDGSSSLMLVWLGRRRIAGIEPGRMLVARGRVGVHTEHGSELLALYNPWYRLRLPADD